MKKVTTGDMLHTYGSFGLHMDYCVRLSIRLKDTVDGEFLAQALENTQKRYPYLSVRMMKDEANIFYEENPAPVVLLNTDERVTLNAEQTNYHIWAVCYKEDRIHLDIYHGISDGTGMYMVLATLLFYYCSARYGLTDHTEIRTLEDPIQPEESLDPQDFLPTLDPSKLPKPTLVPSFSLINDGGMTPSKQKVYEVEIPEDAFMRFTSANDASPGTMVSLLIAHTLDELFPERTKPVSSSYIINARPMLHFPLTHHNCVNTVYFYFSDRIKKMPFDRQCTVYRGITFLQSEEQRVGGVMTVSASRARMVMDMAPTCDARKYGFSQMLSNGRDLFTYLVSYVGKWKYTSLSPYIKEFWTHVPDANDFLIEIAAVNGKIYLTMHQSFEEDCVVQGFLRQLRRHDIPYTVNRDMLNDISKIAEP